MDQGSIDRINQLSRLSRERQLTPEEVEERARLREAYLCAFRESTRQQLDNTYIEYPDGTRVRLRQKRL